jgi:hypothetical protein
MIVLLVGSSSAIYVHATTIDKETITINNNEFTIDQIFSLTERITINTDEGKKTGVALDQLILLNGVICGSCNKYVIKGSGNYQQTIEWDIFKTGVLTDFSRVFFPNTAHSLWVKDVYEIEVI